MQTHDIMWQTRHSLYILTNIKKGMHMKQKKMKLTSKDVKIMFETNLQDIQLIAMNSSSADDFKLPIVTGKQIGRAHV